MRVRWCLHAWASVFFFSLTSSSYGFEQGLIKMKSWSMIRNDGVIRQEKDDSCGASAFATLLNMYGVSVTEAEVLQETNREGRLSFEDIRDSALKRGYLAAGFAGNMDTLKRLKYPVIVFLRIEKGMEHFSVLYGIDENKVYLADPYFGRIVMEIARFEHFFKTRDGPLKGRFLMVFPKKESDLKLWKIPSPSYGNTVAIRHLTRFNILQRSMLTP